LDQPEALGYSPTGYRSGAGNTKRADDPALGGA
jgi:hypothetical protein